MLCPLVLSLRWRYDVIDWDNDLRTRGKTFSQAISRSSCAYSSQMAEIGRQGLFRACMAILEADRALS